MNANELVSRMLETQQVTFSFGKNGWGLSDEFISIGNRIKKLSQQYNVYLAEAKIDTCDDVYDLTFELHPHEKHEVTPPDESMYKDLENEINCLLEEKTKLRKQLDYLNTSK